MFDVIVWATDGSANADLSLNYVQKLAEGGQSRVVAVHVKELIAGPGVGPVHLDEDELQQKIRGQVNDLKQAGIFFNIFLLCSLSHGSSYRNPLGSSSTNGAMATRHENGLPFGPFFQTAGGSCPPSADAEA